MLRLFLLVFLVVIIDANPFEKVPSKCPFACKYESTVGGWLKLHRAPADWFEARAQCQYEGADLASPTNELMLQAMTYISKESKGPCGVYTGIHALFCKGVYTSIDGTPLWKMPVDFATCPTYDDTRDCTILLPSGVINTVQCDQPYPFMCYRKHQQVHERSDCGTRDPKYKFNEKTGQCYKFHLQPKTWPEAYKKCVTEGGHLAIINSAEEAKVIASIFEQHPSKTMVSKFKNSLLLGFKKLKGTWTTVQGQSLQEAGYASWSPGQPDSSPHPNPNGKMEFCGAMFRSGLLDDIWCDVQFAYICEKHPESLLENTEEVALYNQTVVW